MNGEFYNFLKERDSKVCKRASMWLYFAVIVSGVFWMVDFSLYSAQQSNQPAKATLVKTNIVTTNIPVVVEIPKSVFVWNPKERGYGRDPFFPVQPKPPVIVPQTNQVAVSTQRVETKQPTIQPKVDFVLNGVVGKVACIINGKQIMVGAEETLPVVGGKVKVRCDKIENDSAFITIFFGDGSSETRELVLKERK